MEVKSKAVVSFLSNATEPSLALLRCGFQRDLPDVPSFNAFWIICVHLRHLWFNPLKQSRGRGVLNHRWHGLTQIKAEEERSWEVKSKAAVI